MTLAWRRGFLTFVGMVIAGWVVRLAVVVAAGGQPRDAWSIEAAATTLMIAAFAGIAAGHRR